MRLDSIWALNLFGKKSKVTDFVNCNMQSAIARPETWLKKTAEEKIAERRIDRCLRSAASNPAREGLQSVLQLCGWDQTREEQGT